MAFNKKEIALFKKACELNAISGLENEVARFLKNEYEKLGFEIVTDNLGSIFALKKSKEVDAPTVMIDGHMDEIGLICNNPDSSVNELSRVIEEDPMLVANLLKVAKSPLYSFFAPIPSK